MTTSDDRPEPPHPSEVDRGPLEAAAERIGEARKAADEVAGQQNVTDEERAAAADAVADVPVADVPVADVPVADVPDADVPDADVPDADVPDADVPDADVPDADVPDADDAKESSQTRA